MAAKRFAISKAIANIWIRVQQRNDFDRRIYDCVAVVAVLQFQNRFYDSQKLTLYLYINIEVFLGYGKSLSRTATLQRATNLLAFS